MKRGSKTAAWLLAGVLLAGSGNMNISIAAQSGEPLRCISFYSSVNGVSSTIFYVTESLQKNLEGDKEISLSVYSLSTDLYESLEYKVKAAAALDMDVMILSDLPEDLDPDILELLQENHIFVIVVDGQPSSYENSAWIGTDNREMGVRAAQLGAERVAEYQAGVLATSFRGGTISASRKERQVGFEQEAARQEGMTVLPEQICTSNGLEAMQRVRDYMSENPGMNLIYCLDSASGITASRVLLEQGRTDDVYVICYDLVEQVQQEMKQGGIDAVIEQDTDGIGRRVAGFLKEIKKEGTGELAGSEIAVPGRIVEADDVGGTQNE